MTYSIVYGDLGPVMPINLVDGAGPLVLLDTDTATLNYVDPAGTLHSVDLELEDLTHGLVQRTWIAGDLPVVGPYEGLVTVTRLADDTFPRTFANNGTKILWWVYSAI